MGGGWLEGGWRVKLVCPLLQLQLLRRVPLMPLTLLLLQAAQGSNVFAGVSARRAYRRPGFLALPASPDAGAHPHAARQLSAAA